MPQAPVQHAAQGKAAAVAWGPLECDNRDYAPECFPEHMNKTFFKTQTSPEKVGPPREAGGMSSCQVACQAQWQRPERKQESSDTFQGLSQASVCVCVCSLQVNSHNPWLSGHSRRQNKFSKLGPWYPHGGSTLQSCRWEIL